jgi:CubicO group peptidase (beta-lactamase class C family)
MLSISQVRSDLEGGLARLILEHGIPGVSVAVGVGDDTACATAGVVNLRSGVAVAPDSVFQIQSITKVWTATLVMQLVDEGLVDLDDPVWSHLPGFRTADPESSVQITVRHLLSHTGGFEGDIWTPTTTGDDALQRLVEDLVSQAPQHEAPGSRYSYCSAGMAVLGRLIEVRRGLPFASVLRRYLAEPLGIAEIAGNADEALGFNTAIGHAEYPGQGMRPLPVWATMPESNPAAGNQLSMSARALLSFGRMHLADGLGPSGGQVLSEAAAKAMRVPEAAMLASPVLPKAVGLGWELYHGGAVVGHGGGAIGIGSMLLLIPEQRTAVALLTNGGDFRGLLHDLVDPWIKSAVDAELRTDLSVPERSESSVDSARYVGVYCRHNQRVAVSINDDGGLEASFASTGELAAMIERTGLAARPFSMELRRVSGDLFATVSESGTVNGYVEFLDSDPDGRSQFIHAGGLSLPRQQS